MPLKPFFDVAFLQALIATALGVILGIPAALFVDRLLERSSERERKRKILQVIRQELQENKAQIEHSQDSAYYRAFPLSKLRFESWNAFSDGGELQWVKDPALLGMLSDTYAAIRILAYLDRTQTQVAYLAPKQERVWSEYGGGGSSATYELSHAVQLQAETAHAAILETLETLEHELHKLK